MKKVLSLIDSNIFNWFIIYILSFLQLVFTDSLEKKKIFTAD